MAENKSDGSFKSNVGIGSIVEAELSHPIEVIMIDKIGLDDEQKSKFKKTNEKKEKINGNG